ncbi:MAG: 4Fe-4S binding protein [Clostridiales bacterium]|nr:4Fe-4S binding protein [Clostridiales bacterium]
MKQLLILSGKGGTGKTTVACAFIRLAKVRAYADCDIDAPNVHLTLAPTAAPSVETFYGMPKARIDPDRCTACGLCRERCRFAAIHSGERSCFVDPFACEGCGVCAFVCPAGAVSLEPDAAGELRLYAGETSAFSTAQLKMGGGTSGKLVTQVKRRLNEAAPKDIPLAILDGSPGIGCPVIASLSGASMALIVTEPSVSGVSDMERIVQAAASFQTPLCVCVNKADTNPVITKQIEQYCSERVLPFLGTIPFDPAAVRAVNRGLTVVDEDCPSGKAVREIYQKTIRLLGLDEPVNQNQHNGGQHV